MKNNERRNLLRILKSKKSGKSTVESKFPNIILWEEKYRFRKFIQCRKEVCKRLDLLAHQCSCKFKNDCVGVAKKKVCSNQMRTEKILSYRKVEDFPIRIQEDEILSTENTGKWMPSIKNYTLCYFMTNATLKLTWNDMIPEIR